MKVKRFGISLDEAAGRYGMLSKGLQRQLTNYSNFLIGLNLVAYGNREQARLGRESFSERMADGRIPFVEFFYRDFAGSLADIDRYHIDEINGVVRKLNLFSRSGKLTRRRAKSAKEALMHLTYGRATQSCD